MTGFSATKHVTICFQPSQADRRTASLVYVNIRSLAANVRGPQAICMLSSANYFACRSLELRKIRRKEIEVNEHVNVRDTAAEGDMSDRQTEVRGVIP
jgi:hypothetical protein